MSVATFIPEVWSATIQTELDNTLVLAQVGSTVNDDYQGEIGQRGDTVRIGRVGDPTIGTYERGVTVIDPAQLTTTEQVMVIDQAPFFAFELDDLDKAQVLDGGKLMGEAARRSAQLLAERADAYVAAKMVADAGRKLGAVALDLAAATAGDDAYRTVVRLKLALDKAKVPLAGRFLAVDPDFYAVLFTDKRFTAAANYGAAAAGALATGEVGQLLGFTVKLGTAMPVGTAGSHVVIAGHPRATTWAQQVNSVEAYRPQNSFSDAVKGLQLYGAKVVRPEMLATAVVTVAGV